VSRDLDGARIILTDANGSIELTGVDGELAIGVDHGAKPGREVIVIVGDGARLLTNEQIARLASGGDVLLVDGGALPSLPEIDVSPPERFVLHPQQVRTLTSDTLTIQKERTTLEHVLPGLGLWSGVAGASISLPRALRPRKPVEHEDAEERIAKAKAKDGRRRARRLREAARG
jgi:hypothetical protein